MESNNQPTGTPPRVTSVIASDSPLRMKLRLKMRQQGFGGPPIDLSEKAIYKPQTHYPESGKNPNKDNNDSSKNTTDKNPNNLSDQLSSKTNSDILTTSQSIQTDQAITQEVKNETATIPQKLESITADPKEGKTNDDFNWIDPYFQKYVFFTVKSIMYDPEVQTKKGCGKKFVNTHPNGWNLLNNQTCLAFQNPYHSAYFIRTGEINDLTVLDFDTEESYQLFIEKYPETKDAFTVKTRKGYHIYFKYCPKLKNWTDDKMDIDTRSDGGIICGPGSKVTNVKTKEIYYYQLFNRGTLTMEIPKDWLDLYLVGRPGENSSNKPKCHQSRSTNNYEYLCDGKFPEIEMVREILDNIDVAKVSSYSDWLMFIWAIKFSVEDPNIALSIADNYSQKIEGYRGIDDVKRYFDSASAKKIGFPYLRKLSRSSNEENHLAIVSKYNLNFLPFLRSDDYHLAEIAIRLVKDEIIRQKQNYYLYENPYWIEDDEKLTKSRKFIHDTLRNYVLFLFKNLQNKTELDSQKRDEMKLNLDKILAKLNSFKSWSSIFSFIKERFPTNDEVEFDSLKPYYFCFKNKAFCLETNQEVEVERTDYITQTTRYAYQEPDPDQIELIDKLFNQIFPDSELKECYISVLRTCLIGQQAEKFVILTGQGGNGKSMLTELLEIMMGDDYFYRGNSKTLTKEIDTGPCPELSQLNNKRVVIFSESSEEDDKGRTLKLSSSTIKTLTGGEYLNARGLYSSNTKTRIPLTVMAEFNGKPMINGKIGNALLRRFVNTRFVSTYTDKENQLHKPNHYRKNPEYKSKVWKLKHRHALFAYLLRSDRLTIYEPESVINETFNYLTKNDDIAGFMDEYFEESNYEHDYIQISEIVAIYKCRILREGSREFRAMTVKKFITSLKENDLWKDKFDQKYEERYRGDSLNRTDVKHVLKYLKKDPNAFE